MLRAKARTAVAWSGADILLRQGIQFGISIALARLLSPSQFGTVALLYLFVGIASTFVDAGFSSALIQGRDITHTDESTVFWFNLAVGGFFALGLWAIAPAIAGFYNQPVLKPLTGLMAFNVLFSALSSIHGTLLNKRLEFRSQMLAGVIATIASGVVAIVMAWYGFGVWALAVQTLTSSALMTVLLWTVNPWRPSFKFSRTSIQKLFGFGGYLFASSLLDTFYNRFYTLLLGKFYGVAELGFYTRADNTKQLPIGVLTGILSRVSLPIFSSVAADSAQLRRGVRLSLRMMMFLNIPIMIGLSAAAKPLVGALFGAQWMPAAPILQVLCLAGLFWPLHVINLDTLVAQGHTRLFFRLEIIKKLLGFFLLAIGTFYGVMGIAWSQVVFSVAAFLINAHYTQRFLGYGVVMQTKDCLPIVGTAIPMGLIVLGASEFWTPQPLLALFGLSALGALSFLLLCKVFNLEVLRDAAGVFLNKQRSF